MTEDIDEEYLSEWVITFIILMAFLAVEVIIYIFFWNDWVKLMERVLREIPPMTTNTDPLAMKNTPLGLVGY